MGMLGKKEGKVSGAREGTYIVLNGRRVIAVTVPSVRKRRLSSRDGIHGRMKIWD